MGEHRMHVLPPTAIRPVVLDRQQQSNLKKHGKKLVRPQNLMEPSGSKMHQKACRPTSFQITIPDYINPLLVFVNPKSGGGQGMKIMRKFQYLLNPRQVFNLAKGGLEEGLMMFKDVEHFRVICCGGDGTVGWILQNMETVFAERSKYMERPALGIVPLGTGNDLSRCLGWGGGYDGESLQNILKKIENSTTVMMDRWHITVFDSPTHEDIKFGDSIPSTVFNNYFSIGVDAAICVKFHLEREKCPEKFSSRMRNKMWYLEYATFETFAASCKNLQNDLEVICDGFPLNLANGEPLQGITFINIPFTHGGTNLWGENRPEGNSRNWNFLNCCGSSQGTEENPFQSIYDINTVNQDIGDGYIEVIGLENCLHMGQIRTGLRASGRRLAHCSHVEIRTKRRLPMQVDGEPWMQPPSVVRVAHKNQVPVLVAPQPEKKKGIFSCFKV